MSCDGHPGFKLRLPRLLSPAGGLRALLIVGCLVSLTACGQTTQGSLIRDAVKARGAEVYDEGLENAEFFICRAASVGAVMRRYGFSAEKAAAWRVLCTTDPDGVDTLFGIKRGPSSENE